MYFCEFNVLHCQFKFYLWNLQVLYLTDIFHFELRSTYIDSYQVLYFYFDKFQVDSINLLINLINYIFKRYFDQWDITNNFKIIWKRKLRFEVQWNLIQAILLL